MCHTISSFNYSNSPYLDRIDIDLATFASASIGQAILNTYDADVAVLITAQNYYPFAGAAYIGGKFAIVSAPYAGPGRWTFADEVGHLFKAKHQLTGIGQDPNPDCGHGYLFASGDEGITVMYNSSLTDNTVRAPRFSNPNITFNGYTIGTGNENSATRIATAICNLGSITSDPIMEIRNNDAIQEVSISPNPADQELLIEFHKGFQPKYLVIHDLNGRIIHEQTISTARKLLVPIQNWPGGLYTLNLVDQQLNKTIKIVKL